LIDIMICVPVYLAKPDLIQLKNFFISQNSLFNDLFLLKPNIGGYIKLDGWLFVFLVEVVIFILIVIASMVVPHFPVAKKLKNNLMSIKKEKENQFMLFKTQGLQEVTLIGMVL
jgi:hypothetical protein